MIRRVWDAITHNDTDEKIKERTRLAMAIMLKDQRNRVAWLEARTAAAHTREDRTRYHEKLCEEKRELAKLENPEESELFAAFGVDL